MTSLQRTLCLEVEAMEAEAQVPWMPTVTEETQEEVGEVAVLGDSKLARLSWPKTHWVGTDLLERKKSFACTIRGFRYLLQHLQY